MDRRLVDDGSLVAWRDPFSGRHIRLIEPGGLDEYIRTLLPASERPGAVWVAAQSPPVPS